MKNNYPSNQRGFLLNPYRFISGYRYKQINLAGSAGAGTNYQVLLKVGESPGSVAANFYFDTATNNFPSAKNNIGDVQFTSMAGIPLNNWVEQVTGTTPNRVAWIWVNVTADLSTNQSILCTYKNTSAVLPSNGNNTFILFDDFDSGTLDISKWALTGTASITFASSVMTVTGNNSYTTIVTAANLPDSTEVVTNKSPAGTANGYVGDLGLQTKGLFINPWDNLYSQFWYYVGGTTTTKISLDARYQDAFCRIQVGSDLGAIRVAINSAIKASATNVGTGASPAWIVNLYESGTMEKLDWVAFKKYKQIEPIFSSAGPEQGG